MDGPYTAQLPLLVLCHPSAIPRCKLDMILCCVLGRLWYAVGEEDDAIRLVLLDKAGARRREQQREDRCVG